MIKKTFRLKDETAKWIQEGAKEHKIGESEFLDYAATKGLRLETREGPGESNVVKR